MPELTPLHRELLEEPLFDFDAEVSRGFVVPDPTAPHVAALIADLGGSAVTVECLSAGGLHRWPLMEASNKTNAEGGTVRTGWRLREWPSVLLVAEFHAIWVDSAGNAMDIAPWPGMESETLFVPADHDPEAPWPANRWINLDKPRDLSAEVAHRHASFTPGQLKYEERRAAKAGMAMHDWIVEKYDLDPLTKGIPAFAAACDRYDRQFARIAEFVEPKPDDWDEVLDGEWDDFWEVEKAIDQLDAWTQPRLQAYKRIADALTQT